MTTESTGAVGAGTDLSRPNGADPRATPHGPAPPGGRPAAAPDGAAPPGPGGGRHCRDADRGRCRRGRWASLALLPALACLLYLHLRCGLYRRSPLRTGLDELPRLLGCAVLAWCVATSAITVTAAQVPGPQLLLVILAVQVAAGRAARGTAHLLHRNAGRRTPRSALVVGAGRTGRGIITALHEHREYGMRPVGIVVHAGTGPLPPTAPVPVLSSHGDIPRAVIQNDVRDAVFTRGPKRPAHRGAVPLFAELGCHRLGQWTPTEGVVRRHRPRRPPVGLRLRPPGPGPPCPRGRRWRKRALDLALTGPALAAARPCCCSAPPPCAYPTAPG